MEIKLSPNEEMFKCVLCGIDSDLNSVIGHIISTGHRLTFLRKYFPCVAHKFSTPVPESQWPLATFDILDTVAGRIEARYGRGQVTCVPGLLEWERDCHTIRRNIDMEKHARYDIFTLICVLQNLPI